MKTVAEEKGVLAQIQKRAEELAASLDTFKRCIAVSSGKGGVGKSTIASLLSLAFQSQGAGPALLDCDLNGPCQAQLMGLPGSFPTSGPRGMIVPCASNGTGVVSIGSWIRPGRSFEFDSHAPEAGYAWRTAREFSLIADILIGTDWSPFSTLILDLPPGSERMVHFAHYLGKRITFVLVTTPSVITSQVVLRSLTGLHQAGAQVAGYIENMNGYYCVECGSVQPLFSGGGAFPESLELLGSFPYYPSLAKACEEGLSESILSTPPGEIALEISRVLGEEERQERN